MTPLLFTAKVAQMMICKRNRLKLVSDSWDKRAETLSLLSLVRMWVRSWEWSLESSTLIISLHLSMVLSNIWKKTLTSITCRPSKVSAETNSCPTPLTLNQRNSKLYSQPQEVSKLRNSHKTSLISASHALSMLSSHLIPTSKNSAASSKTQMENQWNLSSSFTLPLFTCHATSENLSKSFRTIPKLLTYITQEMRRKPLSYSIPRNSQRYSLT